MKLEMNNRTFKQLHITLQEKDDIMGKIKIKDSMFNDCTFHFKNIETNELQLLMSNNTFNDCHFVLEDSEVNSGKLKLTSSVLNNCTIKFIHSRIYSKHLDLDQLVGLSSEIYFIRCLIDSYSNFYLTTIKNIYFFKTNIEHDVDLRIAGCEKMVLQECKISKVINLNLNDNFELKSLNLLNNINLGQIIIDWHTHRVKELIKANAVHYVLEENHHLRSEVINRNQIANQFLLLKENYRKQGKFRYEDLAYYEYRKYLEGRNIYSYLGDKIGKYGTDPLNILISMIYAIIFFSLIFYMIESQFTHLFSLGYFVKLFPKYLYFSGITFFTIGYSDSLITSHISQFISIVEGFSGVFFMSYFTIAFVRKVLR